jgi:phosphatidylglycerophosphate synthase
MLGNYCRNLGNYICRGLTPRLARLGMRPWMMNLCSVASAVGSGYFFFSHNIFPALLFLFLNAVFDYMDGGISRALLSIGKVSSRYRPLFHVLSDKLSEIAIFLGMIAGKIVRWDLGLLAITTCLILTLFGRWAQHKGTFNLERSLFDRTDRFVVLLLFCSLRHFQLALIIVSILNIAGLIQRLYAFIRAILPKSLFPEFWRIRLR